MLQGLEIQNQTKAKPKKSELHEALHATPSGKRKRRSSSIGSHHNCDSNAYRAQNAKIGFYDARAQKVLEVVVDEIGQAKNMIRKAKAHARIQSFGRTTRTSDEDDDDDDDDTVMAQVRQRRRRTSEAIISSSESSIISVESLDRVDKHLARAQDLCMMAAYQMLRDGDCRLETHRAAEQLKDVVVTVAEEIAYAEERSLATSLKCTSSFEKGMTSTALPRASVDSYDEVPLTSICLTSRLSSL